jgi:hopene-associated glycosyltransferase HpnB
MSVVWAIGCVSLVIWIVLLVGRGGFWLPRPQLHATQQTSEDQQQPISVVAVIPARDEEAVIGETLPTVLSQDFAGELRVILVDDRSEDRTTAIAQQAAEQSDFAHRLTILSGTHLPEGWAGKVWAMNQGATQAAAESADYIWFTDADIAHDPGVLQALVQKAVTEDLDLVSVMAQLRIDSRWDRLLIPAFVYFFAKLYPFRFVNNPRLRTAGAAGGCILVHRKTLEDAGGIAAIRSALIDDCALGTLIKRHGGRVWLGFTRAVRSVRIYGPLKSVWDMVARSAFHQLNYSIFKLVGTIIGMLLIYAAPPAITLAGILTSKVGLAALGGATWALMALSFIPILRHQQAGIWQAPLLPVAGILYTAMTVSSAWRHATGRGGMWKGRPYAGS